MQSVLDWHSDDMTFCSHKGCYIARCERHPSNIKCPEIPHSYSDFYETDYCPIHREKSVMQDEMNDLQYTQPEDPDIVKVVRCHNCVAQRTCRYAQFLGNNGYCSYGERKDG